MPIEELHDHVELGDFLQRNPVANAYLLGDLDPAYMPYCTWYGAREQGQLNALLLLYKGLRLPVVLAAAPGEMAPDETTASNRNLEALFRAVSPSLPPVFWAHVWEESGPALHANFQAPDLKRMLRMGLSASDYVRPSSSAPVRRLGHKDTAAIMALYRYYPDNFFEPYQLESNLYFGVDRDDGQGLCAIAGIHVYSPSYDIAAIGNLLVHPEYRRRGLATAVTTHLLDALFQDVSKVTLNVEEGNVAAIGTYRKFGFQRHGVYFEGSVQSKPAS